MFLQDYILRKRFYTSPAQRNSYYFYTRLNFQPKFKFLSVKKKWNAGRNDSGRTILWTRRSLGVQIKTVRINYNLRYFRLGFIAGFQFVPFKNRLLSLIFFANGAVTYYITSELHNIFSFLYYNKYKKLRKIKLKNTILMLFQIKKLSFVSCLELTPGSGAQYVRSPGVKSRIIKFDLDTHSVLIQLPSGVKKTFSYYSFVLLEAVSMSLNKKCLNTKSGYWRNFGLKSIVRGVAMNPVDHPHGGRTKAVRYQRTPWGKTTKYK